MDLINSVSSILTNPKHTRWTAPLLILSEAVLCGLIIWKVPYTEIDYTTYLHQVSHFLSGERRYTKLVGPSGPLVYPAVHVYIYSALYYFTTVRPVGSTFLSNLHCKDGAECDLGVEVDIMSAQIIFAGLYLVTLSVVMACYRRAGAPTWLLIPLVLSKRLHSIFLLRLFNDAWATLFFWLAVYALQNRKWNTGAMLWCLGVGVKMTLLLAAPAIGVILIQGAGLANAISLGAACVILQLLVASPFWGILNGLEYVTRAFEFSRQFLFEWTVNWRFVGEELFSKWKFAITLLVVHADLLAAFAEWKWLRPSSNGITDFISKWTKGAMTQAERRQYSQKITPIFIMDTMLASMAIGMLCARSLHYQFYAYLGWASPYLLWRANLGPIEVAINMGLQELSWLVFPSTVASSAQVVLLLLIQVVCIFKADLDTRLLWGDSHVAQVKTD